MSAGRRDDRSTTVVPVRARDGHEINLHHVTRPGGAPRGPVLLVHGAGVRANVFRPPEATTIVDALLDEGYDVWLENWRASIDLPPTQWDLDDAARHDHPAAVDAVLAQTGAGSIQAIVHCQGSTSFVMAAVAGLLPGVRTIVSNAVSLHPVIPPPSVFKIRAVAPILARLTPSMDAQWGVEAPSPLAKAIVGLVKVTHRECDNTVCRMVSFTYGTGFPCLWSHENLSDATHAWIRGEFAAVPFTFFAQMARSVTRGHLVAVDDVPELPGSTVAAPPRTEARFVLLAGRDNRCFLPASQERTFAFLDGHRPGRHALHVIDGYGHLDVFIGRHAARDVFPLILHELERA
jgi:pimeloyl-ACP methyl ester carboxylesterase